MLLFIKHLYLLNIYLMPVWREEIGHVFIAHGRTKPSGGVIDFLFVFFREVSAPPAERAIGYNMLLA